MNPSKLPKEYKELMPPRDTWWNPTEDSVDNWSWSGTLEGHNFWNSVSLAETKKQLPKINPLFRKYLVTKITNRSTTKLTIKERKSGETIVNFTSTPVNNCGLGNIHNFYFNKEDPTEEDLDAFDFLLELVNRPYVMANHKTSKEKWFKRFENIKTFKNPNSNNNVSIWLWTNTTKT